MLHCCARRCVLGFIYTKKCNLLLKICIDAGNKLHAKTWIQQWCHMVGIRPLIKLYDFVLLDLHTTRKWSTHYCILSVQRCVDSFRSNLVTSMVWKLQVVLSVDDVICRMEYWFELRKTCSQNIRNTWPCQQQINNGRTPVYIIWGMKIKQVCWYAKLEIKWVHGG